MYRKINRRRTVTCKITRLRREVQQLLAAHTRVGSLPVRLKQVCAKSVLQKLILFVSFKCVFEFLQTIFGCFKSFKRTRFTRQGLSDVKRRHGNPFFKRNLCDAGHLGGDAVVSGIFPKLKNLANARKLFAFIRVLGYILLVLQQGTPTYYSLIFWALILLQPQPATAGNHEHSDPDARYNKALAMFKRP